MILIVHPGDPIPDTSHYDRIYEWAGIPQGHTWVIERDSE